MRHRTMALLALLAVLLLAGRAMAQAPPSGPDPSQRPVKPLERSPHIFYEPQAKYPPEGAADAFRGALPLALAAALGSFGLALWATRPLPELERSLDEREAAEPRPAAPPAPPGPAPAEPGQGSVPLDLPRAPRRARAKAPKPAAPSPSPRPASRLGAQSPLRRFSWRNLAATHRLPLGDGEATGPGLVVYLAEPSRMSLVLAALTADLLRESSGRVILASASAAPEDVVECLLGTGPGTAREERLARLRRDGRRLERLVRRLDLPRGGGLAVDGLLRRGRELSEVGEGLAGVVVEPATRLEMGASGVDAWLRDLHDAGTHGGFPVYLVAPEGWVPAGAPVERTLVLDGGDPPRARIHEPAPA